MSSIAKRTKKTTSKAESKGPVFTPSVESSSKPSKTLKRKKDVEQNEIIQEEKEPVKLSKKAKKDNSGTAKPPKDAPDSEDVGIADEDVVQAPAKDSKNADKKKKAKSISEATPITTKHAPAVVEKGAKSKNKSKDSSAVVPSDSPAPAAPEVKDNIKKSKTSHEVPTSISRPRNAKATTATKPKVAAPEPESDDDDDDAGIAQDSNEDSDEDEHLHGFSTDDDDSSDEEAMDDEPDFDLGKLPTIAKDDATVKRKLEKAKQQPTEDRGVLFLGRLPHGFYEDGLKAYFSQFGDVTRLRVSRNKKTGRSKHYGFVEFDSSAVAEIVAETMDNYLMMGHILRCKVIPKDQVHPELWVGANRKWRVVPKDRVARVEHNKPRTEIEQARATKRLLKRQQERKRKLAKSGINYDFDAASYKKPTQLQV